MHFFDQLIFLEQLNTFLAINKAIKRWKRQNNYISEWFVTNRRFAQYRLKVIVQQFPKFLLFLCCFLTGSSGYALTYTVKIPTFLTR